MQTALTESDAVILLIDGHSPAREPDRKTVESLYEWFSAQPRLKLPPILGIVTHVDLLPPSLEWSPPYDWKNPDGEKEKQIAESVEYAYEVFGDRLAECVPACLSSQQERRWGIEECVFPALMNLLPDSQTVALLRAFEHQLDADQVKILFRQLRSIGAAVLKEIAEID